MQDYLVRALDEDVSILQFINVIRVITGKSMLHNGADGEEHHCHKKKNAKIAAEKLESLAVEDDEADEEVEVEEILSSYIKKE